MNVPKKNLIILAFEKPFPSFTTIANVYTIYGSLEVFGQCSYNSKNCR